MGLKGLFLRFGLAYLVFLTVIALTLHFAGIEISSGLNLGILGGSVFYACSAFAKENHRYFEGSEKRNAIFGFSLINLVVQGVFGFAAIAGDINSEHIAPLLLALLVVSLLHGLFIWMLVVVAKRIVSKNIETTAASAEIIEGQSNS